MGYDALVPLTGALADLFICAIVLRGGLYDPLRRAFAGLALCLASWSAAIWALYHFDDPVSAEWWSRVFRVGICLAPATAFHFTLELTCTTGRRWRAVRTAGYAVGTALAVCNLLGLVVSGVKREAWGWYPIPTPLYAGITGSIVAFFLLIGNRVTYAWDHPRSPRQRVQLRLLGTGFLIQMPTALSNLLPVYGIDTYPLGSLGNVVFVAIVAYGIARHRLMDVDYLVRKVVSFTLASLAVLVPGTLVLVGLARWAAPLLIPAAVMLALAASWLVPLLRHAIETHVQRALFPDRFGSRQRLQRLAARLVHVLDEGELARSLGETVADALDVDRCEVFLADGRDRPLRRVHPAEPAGPPDELTEPEALAALPGPLLASEAEAECHPAMPTFRARGWELAIPLRVNDRLMGLVALGPNRDLRIFSGEDVDVLASVAAGASVALDNARLSRQLRRSETALERAGRLSSLGMLAAGIAHEIRNPLTAVKTFLDLLPARLDDREFLHEFRDLSLSELRRVTDLIADLLSLGRSTQPARRALAVGDVLEPIARLMDTTVRKKRVALRVAYDEDLPCVWADPDQVKQILLNLVLNAMDASVEGGTITVTADAATDAAVTLSVRDEGHGIAPEQLAHIFDPFFTTKETGTGLGLTLVHQMVVEHGGEITVESASGLGTTFRVTLPAIAAEPLAATGS